jgi:hypothetical protein
LWWWRDVAHPADVLNISLNQPESAAAGGATAATPPSPQCRPHLCCLALLRDDACCGYELYCVAQAGFVANLGQQLPRIISHLNILLLTPVKVRQD